MENQEFWQSYERFQKINLVTEAPNPLSYNLSMLCETDLAQAFSVFKTIEVNAIKRLYKYIPEITFLQNKVNKCLSTNSRIFIVGCGASGRLAMLMKRLWEFYNPNQNKRIICVASAGDTSLVRSVEQFEDKADFGIKQLLQQGFTQNDLVIGLSASGESPFILAIVDYALKYSKYKPVLICNNSKESLLERNKNHILTKVYTIDLNVGEMALTGSTRLQATTAMHIALGIALCKPESIVKNELDIITDYLENTKLDKILPITLYESNLLKQKQYILYKTNDPILGLSVLADTTERAPTFNLVPYENNKLDKLSPFYLSINETHNAASAWHFLLGEDPTCLKWADFPATLSDYIQKFDLSTNSDRALAKYLDQPQHISNWLIKNNVLSVNIDNQSTEILLPDDCFYKSLFYKIYLNSHSTLMFGKLGYFFGNMMIYLKPSNFKLIDRAIRYSQFILSHNHNIKLEYKYIAEILFDEMKGLESNQSIVKNVVRRCLLKNSL